jgi:trehalose-6-phosphatase
MTCTQELKTVIGKDCSCNQSPTLRAKLISVGKYKSIVEVRPTMYNRAQWSNAHVGQKITLDNSIIHNMYFF